METEQHASGSIIYIILVVGFAFGVSFASEMMSKQWVFDTEDYQNAARRVSSASKLVDELKLKAEKKYADRLEHAKKELGTRQRELAGLSFRAQFISIGISIASFWLVGTLFDEVVVGRLPFTPIAWFSQMTHRRLPGEDLRDASYLYFFVLANMASRPFIAKVVGSERPKAEAPQDFMAMMTQMSGGGGR